MIIADTGGVLALLDRDDRHHSAVSRFHARNPEWVLPWAILAEVDYLATKHLGSRVARAFLADVAEGLFVVDAAVALDVPAAGVLLDRYADLELGMVDAVVMAQAERHQASAIVTTDTRHFRAVKLAIRVAPRLVPLD